MNVKSTKILTKSSPVFTTIMSWFMGYLADCGRPKPDVSRMLANGIVIGFDRNDFINESCFRGFIKLYKCNRSDPQYQKKYCGKGIGKISMIGFKIVDYDHSRHYLLVSKMEFLSVIKDKMREEFPEYPSELYLGDDDVPYDYQYDRCWEYIQGLSPQEKIVLANAHNEDPFPNSYYENDRGTFSRRTQSDEFSIRFESEISDIDIRDYKKDENEDAFEKMDREILEREESFREVRDGFDYGDWQEFSDIYTRTPTRIEDYELYPIRINCTPKSLKKRGKSPYDTKLGVRQYIWHNMWAKPEPLHKHKIPKSPKYDWEMSEEEKLEDEYNLPENFWEDIEMAYQNR